MQINLIWVRGIEEDTETIRKLQDFSIAELLLMKGDVEGRYGEGTFNNNIGKEILEALRLHGPGSEERMSVSKETIKNEV